MLDKYGIKEKQKIPPEVYFDVIKKCAEVDKKNNTATLRTSQDDTNYQASIYIFLNKKNGFDLNLDDGKYPLLIIENPEVFFEKLKANEKKDKELKVGDDIPVLDNTKEKNEIKKKDQK